MLQLIVQWLVLQAQLTLFKAQTLRTVSYLLGFISLPNKMLLRMVPGKTQGCWAAYVTRPLAWSIPESWGSSPRMALNREDCENPDVMSLSYWIWSLHQTMNWCARLHLLQPEAKDVCVLTFPAPTGPITARSCCGPTVMEMFLRQGASIHWFGTNKQSRNQVKLKCSVRFSTKHPIVSGFSPCPRSRLHSPT